MKDLPKRPWPWFHPLIEAALLAVCCGLAFAWHEDRNRDRQLLEPIRSLWQLMNEPLRSGSVPETGEIKCRIDGIPVGIKMRRIDPANSAPSAAAAQDVPAASPPASNTMVPAPEAKPQSPPAAP